MARLLVGALEHSGRQVVLASQLMTRNRDGDPARQAEIDDMAVGEVSRLIERWRATPPAAWLTYHLYYKAPDLIGPPVCQALGIPYLVAEPSVAMKRAGGPFAAGHRATLDALAQAAAALCLTRHDIPGVLPYLGAAGRLYYLPPFLDARPRPPRRPGAAPTLLAVAMMRAGDKLVSYRRLAESLALITDQPWRLKIVGDGPARAEVMALYARFQDRLDWAGTLAPDDLLAAYGAADLLVWPAHNEAYGMALLEAQAAGLPVVACRTRGVPDVVAPDGARLVAPDDAAAFAAAITDLLADPAGRVRMGDEAAGWAARERTLAVAARQLDHVLTEVGA